MAHDIKSPGVSVQVIDQTSFAAVTQGTVAATVGFAEKGPINVPTLILSKDDFLSTFGNPIVDNYYMGMFADKFLDISTSWFTRIAKEVDHEAVTGTVAPGLDFTTIPSPVFWIELADFPNPNNGIYRVSWTGSTTYTNVDALIAAVNVAFATVLVGDGVSHLSDLLTATKDQAGTNLVIRSDNYINVDITVRADGDATNNVAKITGTGNIGIASGASSTDVGNFAYAFIRVPVIPILATAGSITGTAAMTVTDLNQLSAFNMINLSIDGDITNPYKAYTDLNITPSTGNPATFAVLPGLADPVLTHDWTTGANQTFKITLAGFYHFMTGDTTGVVNATFEVATINFTGTGNLASLVSALNTALGLLITSGANTLLNYVQFSSVGTKLTLVEGTGARKNYGSQCSLTLTDGTTAGIISDLGYNTISNFTSVGTDTTYTAAGVAAKMSLLAPEAIATASVGSITIASRRVGSTSFIEILNSTTATANAISLLHFVTATNDAGSNETNQGVVNFVAKNAGEYGNNISTRTYTITNPVTLALQYFLEVFYGTDSVEVFGPINWTSAAATNFVKTLLATSNYIAVDFGETIEYPNTDTGTPPLSPPPNNADLGNPPLWLLAGGSNGIPTISTEADALAVTALDEYTNKEQYEVDIILAPGFVSAAVVSKLQSVGETRQDVVVLPDPPAFLSYTEIIDWHNGVSVGSTNLTSGYTALMWDWQKDFDSHNAQYVDLPPSIYAAFAIAYTQKNFELWEAPAGPERGIVNSISSYSKPTQAQREYLNNDTDPACVNPIVQFPTEGIMIYGQKTCLRQTKSTNRINVRRTVNFIKRNVEKIARKYIFKLNNAPTWAAITRELNSFLGNIQERGGLQSFTVIFDNTTNTSDRIDQGIMYGKIFIQPTRVAERIFIDLTIQRTGALVGEG